jgi:hypothetical protein
MDTVVAAGLLVLFLGRRAQQCPSYVPATAMQLSLIPITTGAIGAALPKTTFHVWFSNLNDRPPYYNPHIFVDMIRKHGPVEACRRVIMELPAHQAPSGYSQLWERKRLDLTAEVTVLQPEWSSLFERAVRERAEARLRRCGWEPPASA